MRTAIGRSTGQPPQPAPPPLLHVPEIDRQSRIDLFQKALEKLDGKVYTATSGDDARDYAASLLEGKTAVASNAGILSQVGVTRLAGVETGFTDKDRLQQACATADVGITSADYALADTGSLVMLSSHDEARLVSLLPPIHLALVPVEKLLTGLDELLTIVPNPAEVTSSMVFITGPSRTADIEQILVKGVHGPGQQHVVLI
ncbi:MAG: lactate utilization protein [bacterium]|nr:lactate utilization protein [bacterium]